VYLWECKEEVEEEMAEREIHGDGVREFELGK